MPSILTDNDARFAQAALKLNFVTTEQVKTCVDVYRKYLFSGGELPSMPRLLVQKGYLAKVRAEQILRHIYKGDELPPPVRESRRTEGAATLGMGSGMGSGDGFIQSSITGEFAQTAAGNDTEAPNEEIDMIQGLGATVMQGEIKGYKILEVIGEGSMGVVYRAHQISMDRIVALKVLPKSKTKDSTFVEQFLTEARNAGRLNHPNLIRVHEVGRSGDLYYYSMEYVDGLTLGELMDEFEGGRFDVRRGLNIFVQIAAALDHGLRMGIIHREIRPDAIMVTEGDQAKLDGLGLTKDEERRFLESENAYYVSPEQAKGLQADTRSDIYSLGCCLYHALTGEPPFQGGGPKDVLGRRLLEPPTHPVDINQQIPETVGDVIMRMMSRDLHQRFQTPAEVMEALKSCMISMTSAQKAVSGKLKPGMKPGLKPGAGKLRRPLGRAGGLNRGRVRRFRR